MSAEVVLRSEILKDERMSRLNVRYWCVVFAVGYPNSVSGYSQVENLNSLVHKSKLWH